MIEEYTASVYSALIKDLSDVEYDKLKYDTSSEGIKRVKDGKGTRRPYHSEIEVYSFPQTWSSTALGFDGIGGQAFTSALTVVVLHYREAVVYFGGRFAYKIENYNYKFTDDLASFQMEPVSVAHKTYGTK